MSDPAIDLAYNVRNTVSPSVFDRVIAEYRTASDTAVRDLPGHPGIAYDPHSDQLLDVWGIGAGLRPVLLAIHGGYWRLLSRHDTAFMARTLSDHGIATVSVDYGLAPHTPLEEIIRQVRAAVAWIHHRGRDYGLDPDRIVVGGSSAGGHLAASTMIEGWHRDFDLPRNVVRAALPISGLFDIRPLVDSFANEWLTLDPARAAAASPLLYADRPGPPCVVAVAEHDGQGFLDQSRAFHARWSAHSPSRLLIVPERNHYDLFLDLADPNSLMAKALLDLIAGAR
ncbi:alpha/beta hydrolase [Nocardia sp. NPDC056000]|uniref:alpha/beta hydrolase n=1 Tax=Nocardia sp. NPDC056000 TaxID=3345674 RepID=UPI0035D97E4C